MTEIEKLYHEIYDNNLTRSPKHFIKLYEEHKVLFEESDQTPSNPDFDGILRITGDYAVALASNGYSKKFIPYLDKAVELFKKSSTNGELKQIPYYERLIWTRGVENYHQKKYKTAKSDFQYLVENDPDNDKYRNWLIGTATVRIRQVTNVLWSVFFIFFLISLIDKQHKFIETTGIILLIMAMLGELYIFVIKQRLKNR